MHPFDVVILSHSDSNHDIILVLDPYDVNNVIRNRHTMIESLN